VFCFQPGAYQHSLPVILRLDRGIQSNEAKTCICGSGLPGPGPGYAEAKLLSFAKAT